MDENHSVRPTYRALQQQGPELRRSRGDGPCLLQALVGQLVNESVGLQSRHSISGAVNLGSSCQQASRHDRRSGKEPMLDVVGLAWSHPEARSLGGPAQSSAGQACSRFPLGEAKVVQRGATRRCGDQ